MEGSDIINVGTGVTVDKKSFVWKIDNFDIIQKKESMINAQDFEFQMGEKFGLPCWWTVWLSKNEEPDKKNWIGIFYAVKEAPAGPHGYFYSQMSVSIKDEKGEAIVDDDSSMRNLIDMVDGAGWGFPEFVSLEATTGWKSLEINVEFTTYFPTNSKCQATVQTMLEEFRTKFTAKAQKDLKGLVKNPVAGSDIKIISSDQKQFSVPKGILTVRSPVFEAMLLRSEMTEAKRGIIELPDISGATLEVLVNFIYTGELAPDWREDSVLVELTNAAAKYELKDLLEFLDLTLGKVCTLENVAVLFSLAQKLSLKTAEKELLKFINETGTASSENYVKLAKTISDMDCS